MARLLQIGAAIAATTLLCGSAGAGSGPTKDSVAALIGQCGRPGLTRVALMGCLERARALADEDTSPELQSLTADLERQEEAFDDVEMQEGAAAATGLSVQERASDAAAKDVSPTARSVDDADEAASSARAPQHATADADGTAPVVDPGHDQAPRPAAH